MAQSLYLKVIRGNPTPEELAALITVLTARAASAARAEAAAASAWVDGARSARRPAAPSTSPAAWRVSGWAG
ncbi:acyl-CoA carboxylase subunit epsilon [Sphaerisporangium sp. NPDC049002]|uniref:acyl-CoA carboxylase subunit epsilon n=1 Tax=unclassified Sphaerisporangium TaxID=2630420 RepID=UPI0033CC759F